jgi:hypothetical protein
MTKLLATTTLFLTLLVSPLMAKDKILKCYPWGDYGRHTKDYNYYKMTTSFFGKKTYYIRDNVTWKPFCEDENSVRTTKAGKQFPLKKTKGDEAVECLYEVDKLYQDKHQQREKLTIDFDLQTSTHCFGDKFKLGCYTKNFKCERVMSE